MDRLWPSSTWPRDMPMVNLNLGSDPSRVKMEIPCSSFPSGKGTKSLKIPHQISTKVWKTHVFVFGNCKSSRILANRKFSILWIFKSDYVLQWAMPCQARGYHYCSLNLYRGWSGQAKALIWHALHYLGPYATFAGLGKASLGLENGKK